MSASSACENLCGTFCKPTSSCTLE
jgi:hypothetical protein